MREIKFRGKRVDNGEWVYGSLVMFTPWKGEIQVDEYWIVDFERQQWIVDTDTVGQFTGLKDKNSVDIYENDKVIIRSEDEEIGVVKFDETELRYDVEFDTYTLELGCFYGKEVEVVGNIHEVK